MLEELDPSTVYGPFLRFENYCPAGPEDPASWDGSLLFVSHQSLTLQCTPICTITDQETSHNFNFHHFHSYKTWNFWRVNLEFSLEERERPITYYIQFGTQKLDEWTFFLPGAAQRWRMSAYSCSGFTTSVKQEEWMVDGDHPMVRHLLHNHSEKPIHVNFGGGDQIYNDEVFKCESFHTWLDIADRSSRLSFHFDDDMKEEAEDFYFAHYCLHFNTLSLKKMVATIPNVMLWDDHDIFDGWGSYPLDMLQSPVFSGIFQVARRFYLAFQQHTTMEDFEDGATDLFSPDPVDCPSFSFLKHLGPKIVILGVDIRSERTKEQVMSTESWDLIFEKLGRLSEDVEHLLVNFTVPIIYPKVPISEALLETVSQITRISALNALLVKTNILSSMMKFEFGEPELLDDLVDHWTGFHHHDERRRIVQRFQDLARRQRFRVSFLSGDVHCAALGRFYTFPKMRNLSEDPCFMPQLITSAIINPPPPLFAVKLMHSFDRASNRINDHTREKMVRLFKKKFPREQKVLPRRNFTIIEGREDNSLKVTIYAEEDQKYMNKKPIEFEVFIPPLIQGVVGRSKSDIDGVRTQCRLKHFGRGSPPHTPRNSKHL